MNWTLSNPPAALEVHGHDPVILALVASLAGAGAKRVAGYHPIARTSRHLQVASVDAAGSIGPDPACPRRATFRVGSLEVGRLRGDADGREQVHTFMGRCHRSSAAVRRPSANRGP